MGGLSGATEDDLGANKTADACRTWVLCTECDLQLELTAVRGLDTSWACTSSLWRGPGRVMPWLRQAARRVVSKALKAQITSTAGTMKGMKRNIELSSRPNT